jgi:hypothetical protein
MRARGVWLLIPLSWAVSCGGRYVEPGEASYDVAGTTSTVGGSASTQAGKTGTSSAGKASGGKGGTGASGSKGGSGASSGTGAVGVAGACACGPVACAPGYVAVPTEEACCFRCELDLTKCNAARADYARFRQELLDKYSSTYCQVPRDCGIYYESNACGSHCGIPVPTVVIKDLDTNLNTYAKQLCSEDCPPTPVPPCAAPRAPFCAEGACL